MRMRPDLDRTIRKCQEANQWFTEFTAALALGMLVSIVIPALVAECVR